MASKKPIGVYAGELETFTAGDFVPLANGGTGGIDQATAQAGLGLVIGTNVQAYSVELAGHAALASNGIVARTGTGTYASRTLAGTAGRITATNGDGVAGAPTFDLAVLADAGAGTLLKFVRDTYGRVSGTSSPSAADIGAIADSRYVRLDAATALAAGVKISVDATTTTFGVNDLVPKNYVDLIGQGFAGSRLLVRVATTGSNVNLASGAPSVLDTVSLALNDLILVKDQTLPAENGYFTVTTLGTGSNGTWTRSPNLNTSATVIPGTTVFVNEGTLNGDVTFALTTNGPITLNTTGLTFTQISGAGQITASNGILKTGNSLTGQSANTTRIAVGAGGFDLAPLVIGGSGTGTFTKFTVDTYGRVTASATATASDVGAQASSTELSGLAALAANGIVARSAAGTYTPRTLTGTAGRLVVTNGDGAAGAPTFDLASGVMATPGTYTSVTIDTYGRVTAGTAGSGNVDKLLTPFTNTQGATISICQVIYTDASGAKLARADADATRRTVGIVSDATIANAASGLAVTTGVMTASTAQWDSVTGGTGGLVANSNYWLSNVTAGALTTTPPTTGWSKRVGTAISTTQLRMSLDSMSIKL